MNLRKLIIYAAFVFSAILNAQDTNLQRLRGYFPADVKTIAVITPGSSPNPASVMKNVALLQAAGYKVKIMPNALKMPDPDSRIVEPYDTFLVNHQAYIPYFRNSLPAKERIADFYRAWEDPEVDLILCSRGGFGCRDLIVNLDWKRLAKRKNMRIMGFSDCTLLGLVLTARGVGHPIMGPVVTTLADLPKANIDYTSDMLNNRETKPIKLKPIIPGDFEGLPLAGVLSRFEYLAGTRSMPDGHGRVFFLETVGGKPRAYLEELYNKHCFDGAAGIIVCHFLSCGSEDEINAYMKELGEKVKCPVYSGFEFGHADANNAIDLTRKCVVKDGILTFPAAK